MLVTFKDIDETYNMARVIGISGKAGAGKNHVAERWQQLIQEKDPHRTVGTIHYADALKQVCAAIYGWDITKMSDRDFKEGSDDFICQALGVNRRWLIQRTGTNAMRVGISDRFWVLRLNQDILKFGLLGNDYLFIPDVRFLNELTNITEAYGGHNVRVNRLDVKTETTENAHESEISLDMYQSWDDIIENDMSLGADDLDGKIRKTHYKLFKEHL